MTGPHNQSGLHSDFISTKNCSNLQPPCSSSLALRCSVPARIPIIMSGGKATLSDRRGEGGCSLHPLTWQVTSHHFLREPSDHVQQLPKNTTNFLTVLIPFPCVASLRYLPSFPDLRRYYVSVIGEVENLKLLFGGCVHTSPKPGALTLDSISHMLKYVAPNTLLILWKPF